ncbi:hypothetical protein GTO27_04480, partial [Candidatus Bathyarchaeota archaeon]|nr:hypothetical protein [Candidatus Bathyarchaeota archaeon]
HRKYKFHGMTKKEYLVKLIESIGYAADRGLFVVYSAEDCTREKDLNFLKQAFRTAEEAGANRVRIADTMGCTNPHGMAFLVKAVKENLQIPIAVHCHNDMGLALANTLAAVEAGASVVSTSVNGLGERAGITSTEEITLALHILYGTKLFDTVLLKELSKLVEEMSSIKMPP